MLPITLLAMAIVLIFMLNIYIQLTSENKKSIDEQAKKSRIVSNTIQSMFEIIGSDNNATEKIEKLNNVIISEFKPKYSSIVLYDGYDYEVKATNVQEEFIDSIKNVAKENTFVNYVTKNISKYIVSTEYKTLSYRSAIERNIKSAIFSPIYFNNTYLGFWIIEDVKEHSFDDLSEQDLAKFKYNIGLFVENVLAQNTIEIAENTDKQTGFYSEANEPELPPLRRSRAMLLPPQRKFRIASIAPGAVLYPYNPYSSISKYLCFTFCLALKRFTLTCSSVRFSNPAIFL